MPVEMSPEAAVGLLLVLQTLVGGATGHLLAQRRFANTLRAIVDTMEAVHKERMEVQRALGIISERYDHQLTLNAIHTKKEETDAP